MKNDTEADLNPEAKNDTKADLNPKKSEKPLKITIIQGNQNQNIRDHIAELGLQAGEVYKFQEKDGTSYYARLGVKSHTNEIIIEDEDGIYSILPTLDIFSSIEEVTSGIKQRVIEAIETPSEADSWYG